MLPGVHLGLRKLVQAVQVGQGQYSAPASVVCVLNADAASDSCMLVQRPAGKVDKLRLRGLLVAHAALHNVRRLGKPHSAVH